MKYKNWIGAIWAVMIALIISGCNPFESHADGSVVSIQISPDTITTHGTSLLSLAKGNTQKFVAAIVSSDSNNVDITELANWYSSDNSVVTVSSDGTVTAISEGSTTIFAMSEGVVSNYQTITVTAATLSSIQITSEDTSIALGLTSQYNATGIYSDGTTATITNLVDWESSETDVATINANGLVSSNSVGTAELMASLNGIDSNSMTLTVTDASLASIQVTSSTVSLPKGTSRDLVATGVYTDGTTQILTNIVSWISDDVSITTVDEDGMLSALSEGTTTVTASLNNVMSNSAFIEVTAAEITAIQITPSLKSVAKGLTQQYVATGIYSDSTTVDITDSVSWVSSDTSIATVGKAGLATTSSIGSTTISATLSGVTNQVTLTVTSATLVSIQVSSSKSTISAGLTSQMTAIGTYTDLSTLDLTDTVAWTTSDTTIATIDSSGLITGIKEGSFTASAVYDAISSNEVNLTISKAELQTILVTPKASSTAKGTTKQFKATGNYSDSTTADISSDVNWTSSATDVATISSTGLATGVTEGSTTINASLDGVSASTDFTVSAAVIQSIAITPEVTSIAKGNTQQFTAIGTYSDASTLEITSLVSWITSDTNVITLSSVGYGQSTNEGTATVTASLDDVTSNGSSITVTAAEINAISITTDTSSLLVSRTLQYAATATYSDGSTADVTSVLSWGSSNLSVGTIGLTGLFTSIDVGSATITATDGTYSDSIDVDVKTVSMCGSGIDDTDATNGEGECIKVVKGTSDTAENLLFTGDPSITVLNFMGYSVDSTSSNTGYTYAQGTTYAAFRADGLDYDSDKDSDTYGQGGQYDRYCQDLAAIKFAGYSNWRRATYQEMYDLSYGVDIPTTYGWSSGAYWTSTYGLHLDAGADGFISIELNGEGKTWGRVASYNYYASCVASD